MTSTFNGLRWRCMSIAALLLLAGGCQSASGRERLEVAATPIDTLRVTTIRIDTVTVLAALARALGVMSAAEIARVYAASPRADSAYYNCRRDGFEGNSEITDLMNRSSEPWKYISFRIAHARFMKANPSLMPICFGDRETSFRLPESIIRGMNDAIFPHLHGNSALTLTGFASDSEGTVIQTGEERALAVERQIKGANVYKGAITSQAGGSLIPRRWVLYEHKPSVETGRWVVDGVTRDRLLPLMKILRESGWDARFVASRTRHTSLVASTAPKLASKISGDLSVSILAESPRRAVVDYAYRRRPSSKPNIEDVERSLLSAICAAAGINAACAWKP